jgi:hypothetical protein
VSDPHRDVREIVRDEPLMRGRILQALRAGSKTVPEIAAAIGSPEHEVMFWVMGMRRYGSVVEQKDVTDQGYFRYQAVEGKGS